MADTNSTETNGNGYPNQQQQIVPEVQNSVDFKLLFNKFFLRHWYLYVYTITLAMITAYFYNWYTTPVYYTSSTVLVKDDKKFNSNDLLSQLGTYNNEGGIENEIGIIRSRQLIFKSLQELGYDRSYFLKGDIKTQELYSSSPIALIGDTLFPTAYNMPISVKVIDDKKARLSYNYLGKTYSTITFFDAKIRNRLGVFIIEKTNRFNNDLFRKKNIITATTLSD